MSQMRWFLAGALLCLIASMPRPGYCGDTKSWGTTLVYVEGLRAEEILSEVTKTAKGSDGVKSARARSPEAWEKIGGKPLGKRPAGSKSRAGAADHLRSVAKGAGAQTVVFVSTYRTGKTHSSWLFVVHQSSGAVVDRVVQVAKRSGKRVKWDTDDLLDAVEDALDDPPSASAPARVASGGGGSTKSVQATGSSGRQVPWEMRERLLKVSTSWGFGKRRFEYQGEQAGALRESEVPSAVWDFSLELYPFAGNAIGAFPKLGLRAWISKGVKSRSRFIDASGGEVRRVDNPWHQWELGFVVKEVIGGQLSRKWGAGLDLGVGYGQMVLGYNLPLNDARQREVPATGYNVGRVRLDVWTRYWYNNFRLYGAYLPVMSGGQVADDLFPRAKIQAGEAGFEYMYLNPRFHGFAVTLNAVWQGFFYDLNAIRGDARVADTARDQYVRVVVGGAFVLDSVH